jgi:hypothetical protein
MITIGGLIYLLYRPQDILLFQITDYLGLNPYITTLRNDVSIFSLPSFVINSIPAGLWTASYLLLMYCNTRTYNKITKLLITLPLPIAAIILEFMQLLGWCPGTFDLYDLICYAIPLIIFLKSI